MSFREKIGVVSSFGVAVSVVGGMVATISGGLNLAYDGSDPGTEGQEAAVRVEEAYQAKITELIRREDQLQAAEKSLESKESIAAIFGTQQTEKPEDLRRVLEQKKADFRSDVYTTYYNLLTDSRIHERAPYRLWNNLRRETEVKVPAYIDFKRTSPWTDSAQKDGLRECQLQVLPTAKDLPLEKQAEMVATCTSDKGTTNGLLSLAMSILLVTTFTTTANVAFREPKDKKKSAGNFVSPATMPPAPAPAGEQSVKKNKLRLES